MSKHRTLGQMVDAHLGSAALILGGGLGLPAEFERARRMYPEAVLISANHRGCLLGVASHRGRDLLAVRRELGEESPELVEPQYACHLDDLAECCPDIFGFPAQRISPMPSAHVRLLEYPHGSGSSAMLAAWVAYMLGCAPIVLCGMDCYGRGAYWHEPRAHTPGLSTDAAHHAAEWERFLPQYVPREIVRAAGGPLVEVFGAVEPGLSFPPYDKELVECDVEFLQETQVGGVTYGPKPWPNPPDIARFSYRVASWLVETGRAAFR